MVPSVTTSKLPRLVHPAWHSFLQRTRVRRREFKEMGYTRISQPRFPWLQLKQPSRACC